MLRNAMNNETGVNTLEDLSSWQERRREESVDHRVEEYADLLKAIMRRSNSIQLYSLEAFIPKLHSWELKQDVDSVTSTINSLETIEMVSALNSRRYYRKTGVFYRGNGGYFNLQRTFIVSLLDRIVISKEAPTPEQIITPYELEKTVWRMAYVSGVSEEGWEKFIKILSLSLDHENSEIRSDGFIRINQYIDTYYELMKENQGFDSMPQDWRLSMTDTVFESMYEKEGRMVSL